MQVQFKKMCRVNKSIESLTNNSSSKKAGGGRKAMILSISLCGSLLQILLYIQVLMIIPLIDDEFGVPRKLVVGVGIGKS